MVETRYAINFIHYEMYNPNGRVPVILVFDSKTFVSLELLGRRLVRGGFLPNAVMCFSDTYVFLAIRIICTRQVANCGPGFNVEFICNVTQIVLVSCDSETRHLVHIDRTFLHHFRLYK